MPYKDSETQREAEVRLHRIQREELQQDPVWLKREALRKAEWYAENKEKKADAQRAYRARLKESRS